MSNFIRLLKTLDYMRIVLGICILVDGYPLIFFFRETMRLAPGSTAFTAAALAGGLVLMVPFTFLRRLYRPNMTMFWMGLGFLLLSIIYMYLYNGVPGFEDSGRDMIYYAYMLIFLFLLINIPNEIIPVFIPVVVIFTLLSNLGLVYALITDPTWAIGQRATITLNNGDPGSGNPHSFSRNAFMGAIACAIWLLRPNTHVIFRLLSFFAGVLNIAVLVLTQTRSAIVALALAIGLFLYFNVRPAQIRQVARSLVKPIPITIMVVGFLGVMYFFQRYLTVYFILYDYVTSFAERNLETVYAMLGLKAQGADYKAVLDDSTANRSASADFLRNVLLGHIHMLILGYGYKFLYLDVPIMEALADQGILGLVLFGGVIGMASFYSLGIMRRNPNPLSVFLAYFFLLILIQSITNGRPYEISFWFPLALMIRFMGVDHLFPNHLQDNAPVDAHEQYVVIANPESA
ncbi:O-antigen ligase family protein [Spirosoma litoris]